MAWDPGFETAFDPRAVAFVGATPDRPGKPWGGGTGFIRLFQKNNFKGNIYPVNLAGEDVLGLKGYTSLSSLPERPDLVVVAVPARVTPSILEECGSLGIKNIHIFTAGFDETGTEEGRELGEKVKAIARQRGLRILGPNCMGLEWFPKVGMATHDHIHKEGPVSFISQSGLHCYSIVALAHTMGIGFNKVVSFGNGYGLNGADFLEYLATDPETEVICMYLEGGQDGHRLFELVRDTTPRKPVIIWKAGLTESGSRAVSSHTGSLGGQAAIWQGFFRQTGAVPVNSIEEMVYVLQCFRRLPPPAGRRVATIIGGGGNSVASADVCSREGLTLPPLAPETMAELSQFIPTAGNIIRNPLDIFSTFRKVENLRRAMDIVSADPSVESIIIAVTLGLGSRTDETLDEELKKVLDYLREEATSTVRGKPLLVVAADAPNTSHDQSEGLRGQLAEANVAVFPSLSWAARSLSLFQSYHARIAGRFESVVLSRRGR